MSAYLLDTNILSELARQRPEPGVERFFHDLKGAYISVLTVYELNYGLELLPDDSSQRLRLAEKISAMTEAFGDRILSVGYREAKIAARMRASAQKSGRTFHVIDLLIAATAFVHGLTVVTRNQKDFERLEVKVLNPWD